jgi:hypothetical protein
VQVVDPVRGDDLHARGVPVDVQDRHFLELILLRRVLAAATAGTLNELHRTDVLEARPTLRVGHHDALRELRVESLLHARRVSSVPALDVVQCRLLDGSRVCSGDLRRRRVGVHSCGACESCEKNKEQGTRS